MESAELISSEKHRGWSRKGAPTSRFPGSEFLTQKGLVARKIRASRCATVRGKGD